MSLDLPENPAARLTQAPEHNGLFMLAVSDPDVWCSTPWFKWHPPSQLCAMQPGLCLQCKLGVPMRHLTVVSSVFLLEERRNLGMLLGCPVLPFHHAMQHYVKEDLISPWLRWAASALLFLRWVHGGTSTRLCVSHGMAHTQCMGASDGALLGEEPPPGAQPGAVGPPRTISWLSSCPIWGLVVTSQPQSKSSPMPCAACVHAGELTAPLRREELKSVMLEATR